MAFKFPNPFTKSAKPKSTLPVKKKAKGTPLIGKLPVGKQLQLLSLALVAFLVIAVISAYFDNREAAYGTRYVGDSSKLLMLSQRMAKDAQQALLGNFGAFEGLSQGRQRVNCLTKVMLCCPLPRGCQGHC